MAELKYVKAIKYIMGNKIESIKEKSVNK